MDDEEAAEAIDCCSILGLDMSTELRSDSRPFTGDIDDSFLLCCNADDDDVVVVAVVVGVFGRVNAIACVCKIQ